MGNGSTGDGSSRSGASAALVQIVVAIIGVTGVISAALFANWDKIFGRAASVAPTPSASPVRAGPAVAPDPAMAAPTVDGGAGAAQQAAPSAMVNAAGIWRDTAGYSFDVRQQGSAITYQQYYNGAPIGGGSGRIDGMTLRYGYATSDDRGQCVGQIAGNQISGRCQSENGNSWPFVVTR